MFNHKKIHAGFALDLGFHTGGTPATAQHLDQALTGGLGFFLQRNGTSKDPPHDIGKSMKFNMEPENDGFQKESPFPGTSFQVPC